MNIFMEAIAPNKTLISLESAPSTGMHGLTRAVDFALSAKSRAARGVKILARQAREPKLFESNDLILEA